MTRNRKHLGKLALAAALSGAIGLVACGDDDKNDLMGQPTGDGDQGDGDQGDGDQGDGDQGDGDQGDGDGPVDPTCPELSQRTEVVVGGDITEDTEWSCDNLYVMQDSVFVKNGAKLKIGPGTEIQSTEQGALFVTSAGRIEAVGNKNSPIVFTSYEAPENRARGNWKGVVLLGKAPINRGENVFEGLPDQPEHRYGGSDAKHDCGKLNYVRIEWAGYQIVMDKELNGLTVAGCGTDTDIDYVQVHASDDDGIEFFGGTASAKHIVVSGADDDSIDWDEGWSGSVQFAVIQQHDPSRSALAENGFEANNQTDGNSSATPVSSPTFYNLTMVGAQSGSRSRGMLLRQGTAGTIRNVLVQGFPLAAIDVRNAETVANLESGALSVENSLFFQAGPQVGGVYEPFPEELDAADNDNGFVEKDFFTAASRNNLVNQDPKLGAPFNLTQPNFVPAADSPVKGKGATPPAGFDASATYIGAFEPGGEDWTAGWTSFPAITLK